jgi:hypothetical protein
MDDLIVAYDYISFDEDYKDEFYSYSGGNSKKVLDADEVVFWKWPCSGEVTTVAKLPAATGAENAKAEKDWLTTPVHAYLDREGREWGFIPYFYGSRNFWICLSDPSNAEIPAINPPPAPELWPSADPDTLPPLRSGIPANIMVIASVAAVVIGSAVMIRIFWKPIK